VKEQLHSPDFDADKYERPNQNWICGHATEGKACRIGPDLKGHCRATFECQPVLETKEGQTKGRWRCTRTTEYGGPCASGPRPDGACSRPITKCVPLRTVRNKRKLFTLSVAAFTAAVLLVGLSGPFRGRFINPGTLSAPHSTEAFARMAGTSGDIGNCKACHPTAEGGPRRWLAAAFGATPGPFQLRELAAATPPGMDAIDHSCAECHKAHSFHEPNVVREHSCSACHQEHRGPGPIKKPTDANCLSCHADTAVMQASYEKGKTLPPSAFDFHPDLGRIVFKAPRPERGYTKVIHSFATDHPEFQVLSEKVKDPNSLRFNHSLHLTSPRIQPLGGKKLECSDCHKADAAGVLHLKITYEENCKSCHSLQFDVRNPELRVPHGNAEHVRAFLRNLPEQYAELGEKLRRKSGRELETFVEEQMRELQKQFASGEQLERRVFLSDARTGPVANVAGLGELGPARFPGCAYCHQVATDENGTPAVSKPIVPDRWLMRGNFVHAKHFKVDCVKCHDALPSRETSDVLLPAKASCAECHSPQGGVASNCSECHSYHTPRRDVAMPSTAAR
jgi:hypothetical protein